MSLIEQALRRLKEPVLPPEMPPSPTRPRQEPAARPQEQAISPAHSWPTTPPTLAASSGTAGRPAINTPSLSAALVMGVTAVLLVSGLFWLQRTWSTQPAVQPAPSASLLPAPDLAAPAGESSEHLILSGIVEGAGNPYAVINGTVVGVGESIADATLLSVQDGAATLRRANGTETVLRVSH